MSTSQINLFLDTKIDLNIDGKRTADILGVSALIAYELQRMPTANYEFDMENIVRVRNLVNRNCNFFF